MSQVAHAVLEVILKIFMKTYDTMRDFTKGLQEASQKTIVWTFGRFQPPTAGHQRLIRKVIDVARKNDADYRIYVSRRINKKDNPLRPEHKIKYMNKMFRNVNIIDDNNMTSPFHVAKKLSDEGYKNVIMVVGSDRVTSFKTNISKYINHSDPDKNFAFDSFKVISAGERDPDMDDVSGVSASKVRSIVKRGKLKEFQAAYSGLLNKTDAGSLFELLRKSMGIKEDIDWCNDDLSYSNFSDMTEFQEFEYMLERSLTDKEENDKEYYVKKLKKKTPDFKTRYGDDWKSVMYGTATNMAKNNEEHGAGEEGTLELVHTYMKDTPGQKVKDLKTIKGFQNINLNEMFVNFFGT
jgi:hypothetical protein